MSIPPKQYSNGVPGQHNLNSQTLPPNFFGLRPKMLLVFVILTLLAAIVLIAGLFIQVRNNIRYTTQQHMIELVSIAALKVDADANAALIDPSQENSDEYLKIRRILQTVRDSSADIRYVYTVRYINNQEMFIVDAETDPELVSHLGDIYEDALPSALSRMAVANQPYVEPEINTDQWGTWMTSCAPLFRANGARGDFLCMDISAEDQVSQERQFLWIALAILAVILPITAFFGWWMGDRMATPLMEMINGAEDLADGNTPYQVNVTTRDETALLANTFNHMEDQLHGVVTTLKNQVEGHIHETERRSAYLTAAAELSRLTSANLDADRLIRQGVEIIRNEFNLYYVGLFLLGEDGKWADLRAGTGKAGQALVARHHRIAIGEGMIGWCIANAQARVAQEVSHDNIRIEIPELPNTRSEAAIPLLNRGRIIGALSVQSEQEKAFDEITLESLHTMTNQVAIALENTRLLAESREAFITQKRASVDTGQVNLTKPIMSRKHFGYYADMENTLPLDEDSPGLDLSQLDTKNILHLPIRVRGQVLGTIHARKQDTEGIWNTEEIALLATLTDQLSLALDNARLYQDTQLSAEREHVISDITAKVRASTNMNVILQTAVKELAEALRVSKATIKLMDEPEKNVSHSDRTNGGDSNA
jgi:GAF domain-containing protein